MRLEPGHREAVTEQGVALLDTIERGVLSLSGSGDHGPAYEEILAATRLLGQACAVVRDFAELTPAIADYEALVGQLRDEASPCDAVTGGLLMQAVAVFRHAISNLGSGTRAAETLLKGLRELRRVMAAFRQKLADRAAHAPSAEVRALFLQDEAGIVSRIAEVGAAMAADPISAGMDSEIWSELFRLFHTMKGNAAALGFVELAEYAHVVEDVVHLVLSSRFGADERASARSPGNDLATVRIASDCAMLLKVAFVDCRAGRPYQGALKESTARVRAFLVAQATAGGAPNSNDTNDAGEAGDSDKSDDASETFDAAAPRFLLSVRVGARELLIPSDSVAKILRYPSVLAVPGGRKGWLGVIRSGAALVPLLDSRTMLSESEDSVSSTQWVVVLDGGADPRGERFLFSVPVDDVREVLESPPDGAGLDEGAMLDVPALMAAL